MFSQIMEESFAITVVILMMCEVMGIGFALASVPRHTGQMQLHAKPLGTMSTWTRCPSCSPYGTLRAIQNHSA